MIKIIFCFLFAVTYSLSQDNNPKTSDAKQINRSEEPHSYEFIKDVVITRYDIINNKPVDSIKEIGFTGFIFDDMGLYEIKNEPKEVSKNAEKIKKPEASDINGQTDSNTDINNEEDLPKPESSDISKDKSGKEQNDSEKILEKKNKPEINSAPNTKVRVIKLWDFKKDKRSDYWYKTYNQDDSGAAPGNSRIYFYITDDVFNDAEKVIKRFETSIFKNWDFVFGPMITPVKYRTANSEASAEFSSAVNLGLAIGLKCRISKYRPSYLVPYFSVGISNVSIDSLTSKGYFKQSNQVASYTVSTGLLFQYFNAQIGLSVGLDLLSGEVSKMWVFNKKMWYGIGIGLQLFGTDEKDK